MFCFSQVFIKMPRNHVTLRKWQNVSSLNQQWIHFTPSGYFLTWPESLLRCRLCEDDRAWSPSICCICCSHIRPRAREEMWRWGNSSRSTGSSSFSLIFTGGTTNDKKKHLLQYVTKQIQLHWKTALGSWSSMTQRTSIVTVISAGLVVKHCFVKVWHTWWSFPGGFRTFLSCSVTLRLMQTLGFGWGQSGHLRNIPQYGLSVLSLL